MKQLKKLFGKLQVTTLLISFCIIWVVLVSFVFPFLCLTNRWTWSHSMESLVLNLSYGVIASFIIYGVTSVLPAIRQRQTIEPIICSIWDKAISEHEKIMSEIRYLEKKHNEVNELGEKENLPDRTKISRILERIPVDVFTNSVYCDGSHRRFFPFVSHRLSFVGKYIHSKSGIRPYMTAEENTTIECFSNLFLVKDHSVDDPTPYDGVNSCSWLAKDFDDYICIMKEIYTYRSSRK